MITARELLKQANGEGEEEEAPQRSLTGKEKETLKSVFKAHPSPSDEQVHELAESMNVSPHALEEEIYKMVHVEKTAKSLGDLTTTRVTFDVIKPGDHGFVPVATGVPPVKLTFHGRKDKGPFSLSWEKPERGLWARMTGKGKVPEEALEDAEDRATLMGRYWESHLNKTAQKHEHVPDSNFDSKQLAMGTKVEKEHTDDPEKAKEVAKDHLVELPDYYTRLKKMESEGEKAKEGSFEYGFCVELQKIAKDMPDFTKQDRPKKVKEIYRALKRDHPDMPAEMKARIAARQGKPGKQHQGPPYKGPLTKTSKKSWMSWIQTNLNPFAQGGRAKAPKASKAFGGTSNQKLLAQYMK
jgi:hypothetical protein